MTTVVVTQGTTRTVQVATAGPQGVRGAQGWVWQGPWDVDTDYAAEVVVGGVVTVGADVVHHDGSAWLAVADSTGAEPGTAPAWELIAEKGEPTTLTVTATTLPVGEPATATITGDAPAQAIAFGLPTGATGATGATGPANSLAVGTVTTTDPGTDAAATITGTPPSQTLDLSIPRGAAGLGVGTLGNLLTAAQATPSTGQFTLSGATEAAGLVLTASGSGAYSAYATVASVVAGQTWTAMATLAPTGRAVATRISWRNSGGAEISAVAGDSIAAGATGVSMAVGVAPAGAVSVRAYPAYAGTGTTGDTVTVTKASFHGGAGGEWVAPGVPVPNLGRRVQHPSTDDVWVQVWDGALGRWATARYDSGWRALSSWDAAGAVVGLALGSGFTPRPGNAGSVEIRRCDDLVHLRWRNLVTTSGSIVLYPASTLSAGFRAPGGAGVGPWGYSGAVGAAGSYTHTNGVSIAPSPAASVTFIGIWASAAWVGDDAIPTSLMGTLVSAAPA